VAGMLKTLKKLKRKAIVVTAALVAQTTTTAAPSSVDLAQNIANSLSQLLFPLITIVIIIALPLLIFKVLGETVLDIIKR
jgi:hypothetical protein